MDTNSLATLIGNYGFPIVAFFLTFFGMKYSYDKSQEITRHAFDELHNLADAVNNNTRVLTELVEMIKEEWRHD